MVKKYINLNIPKHQIDKNIRSPLTETLRNEYHKRNARVIKGDTVKVLRGEYKNVEGKVEKVKTRNSSLLIEGIQREASKGGKVKVQIHSSNVMITSLNLQDKERGNIIRKIKTVTTEKKGSQSTKSAKPKRNRKLNLKNVVKKQPKRIIRPKRSDDNKGEK
ncbi:MAG TPA: 50S ribosomal protein L24 [Nitrososphaeraceae archaeon]|jgi:large subunit ribosomal protein L24|nr:50S ribosomal protein L24 [Nitrososphaeraceae archaeon]